MISLLLYLLLAALDSSHNFNLLTPVLAASQGNLDANGSFAAISKA